MPVASQQVKLARRPLKPGRLHSEQPDRGACFAVLMHQPPDLLKDPGVTKIGGISEMLRITALARSRGVTVAPHSPYFGPGLAATAHLCAALMPERLLEWYFCDVDARPFGGEIDGRGGHIMVPQGPGLGVGPDHDAIARFRK